MTILNQCTVGLCREAKSAFVPVCVVHWVGFQKMRTCWETAISLTVSHPFYASTAFLCFSVMHNPWPIPQCQASQSNRTIHTVNTCFHLMVRSCAEQKKIKPAARRACVVLGYRKTFPDNRGNETDSHSVSLVICTLYGGMPSKIWDYLNHNTTNPLDDICFLVNTEAH